MSRIAPFLFLLAATSYAQSDATYSALRTAAPGDPFTVQNIVLHRDNATITLKSGALAFTPQVNNRDTVAVFAGEGSISFDPATPIERARLRALIATDKIEETFDHAVFCFTDSTGQELHSQLKSHSPETRLPDLLRSFRKRLRVHPESPRSLTEALVVGDAMDNIEAQTLADLYNPEQAGFFSAYMHGRKHNDLRFLMRPRGSITELPSPEEVALINVDPGSTQEGLWYLSHFAAEIKSGKASSNEDHRSVEAVNYRIETTIAHNDHLAATTTVRLRALTADRVLAFNLLPNLRVTSAKLGTAAIPVIQEDRREDPSLYVVLPQPMKRGETFEVALEYAGDKVIQKEGAGVFSVDARENWYPNVNSFHDHAKYDLTFHAPKGATLVSVGKLENESTEKSGVTTHWVSEQPIAVAGFNYGNFKKRAAVIRNLDNMPLEGYANTETPDYLKGAEMSGTMGTLAPSRLMDGTLVEAQNAMSIFSAYFGKDIYGRIAITQQPQFSFGQSWPTLVYLPISAYLDSNQRHQLMGSGEDVRLSEFVDEVTAHEVSHQWWGHMVGCSTYHDEWLSEGFAFFSAGLYLQAIEKTPVKALRYWENAARTLTEKNSFGQRANDAGPVWLGLRLSTAKSSGAYDRVVYRKGGYILYMLRNLMRDNKDGDKRFIEMMHDFVATHLNGNASTEDFQKIAEKHMLPVMDLDHNGKLDWFFREWVYGIALPHYKFDYTVTPDSDGKWLLKATLTQSEVPDSFAMLVPVYLDFGNGPVRLGEVSVRGNSTMNNIEVKLPQKPVKVSINAFHDLLEQ